MKLKELRFTGTLSEMCAGKGHLQDAIDMEKMLEKGWTLTLTMPTYTLPFPHL